MQIVVYTPPYEREGKKYTYVPHLVEHCVGRDSDIDPVSYFATICKIEGTYLINFSVYTFGDNIAVEQVKKWLSQPLSPYIINQEKEIIHQEINMYEETEDSLQKTIETKHYNHTYKEDEFLTISTEQLLTYHQTWYQPDAFIVTDEDFNLILPKHYPHKHTIDTSGNIFSGQIEFADISYIYLYGDNTCRKTYYKLLFIKELLTEYIRYTLRYKDIVQFDYPEIERYMSLKDWFVVYPETCTLDIDISFYDAYKTYFLETLFSDYDTAEFCYYTLLNNGKLTKKDIYDLVSDISYNDVSDLID